MFEWFVTFSRHPQGLPLGLDDVGLPAYFLLTQLAGIS